MSLLRLLNISIYRVKNLEYNSYVSKNINQIIKTKLKQRQRFKFVKNILNFLHISVRNLFIFGVPTMALFFTTFLAWQVSVFNYSPINTLVAVENSSVLGVKETVVKSQNDEKVLDIKLIRQDYPLSCESASLQMALKYYNIEVSQDKLLEQIGTSDPKEIVEKDGKIYWGDPNLGFVGDVKGWFYGNKNGQTSLKYGTGWGVFNGPVLKVAKSYRPNSYLVDNGKIEQVNSAIEKNNPVLFWHRRDDIHQEKIQITTNQGRKIDYQQMHVALVYGFYEKDGVVMYKINDPFFGQYEIDQEGFARIWGRHDNQMVVVV